MSSKVGGLLISDSLLTAEWFFFKRYGNFWIAIVMQSYASNNGSLSKGAPYLNALSTRNFKCQLASRYFTPINKAKTVSVKENVKLLLPVVHIYEASLAYSNIALHFLSVTCSPLKKPGCSQFSNFRTQKASAKTSGKASYLLAAIVDIAFLI